MPDVASLIIKADSSQVQQATKDLDQFAQTAKRTEAANDQLSRSQDKVGAASDNSKQRLRDFSTQLSNAGVQAQQLEREMEEAAASMHMIEIAAGAAGAAIGLGVAMAFQQLVMFAKEAATAIYESLTATNYIPVAYRAAAEAVQGLNELLETQAERQRRVAEETRKSTVETTKQALAVQEARLKEQQAILEGLRFTAREATGAGRRGAEASIPQFEERVRRLQIQVDEMRAALMREQVFGPGGAGGGGGGGGGRGGGGEGYRPPGNIPVTYEGVHDLTTGEVHQENKRSAMETADANEKLARMIREVAEANRERIRAAQEAARAEERQTTEEAKELAATAQMYATREANIATYIKSLEQQSIYLHMNNEEAAVAEALVRAQAVAVRDLTEEEKRRIEQAVRDAERMKKLKADEREAQRENIRLAQDLSRVVGTAFEDAILSGQKFSKVLAGLAQDLARVILRATITKQMQDAIGKWAQGGFGFGGGPSNAPTGSAESSLYGGGGGGFGGLGGLFQSGWSLFSSMFAGGGIMTPRGPMPLHAYAGGGVADRPQMAIFAEGRKPEAYVPLDDGRTIPVTMRGGGGNSFFIDARDSQLGVEERVRVVLAQQMPRIMRMSHDYVVAQANRGGTTAKALGRRR